MQGAETATFRGLPASHLRWDFVWQRPQQFLSRLSQNRRVLFCEGPLLFEEEEKMPHYTLHQDPNFPNVTVMQTHLPTSHFQDGLWIDDMRLKLLKEALCGPLYGLYEEPIQWFYDPMAVPAFLHKLHEVAVVYDCMDELSQFKFAPPEIIERERLLLSTADVIFTGGRKMWESKSRFNKNCHFYGCGVDVAHFSQALQESTKLPDVVSNFSSVTQIAHTPDEFIECCRQAITSPDKASRERGFKMASDNTREAITAKMEKHLKDVSTSRTPKHIKRTIAASMPVRSMPVPARKVLQPSATPVHA